MISGGKDHVVRVLDLRMMKQRQYLKGHNHEITGLSYHPDYPNIFVSSDYGGKIFVWGIPFGAPIDAYEHLNEDTVMSRIKASQANNFGAHGYVDVNITTTERTGIGKFNPMMLVINQVEFSPNGNNIASLGNDRFIQFWE